MKIENDRFTGTLDEFIEYFFKTYGDLIEEMEDKAFEEYLKANPDVLKAAEDFCDKLRINGRTRRPHKNNL